MYLKIIIWEIRLDKLQQELQYKTTIFNTLGKREDIFKIQNLNFTRIFYMLKFHFILYSFLRCLSSYIMKTKNWSHSWLHSHPPVSRQTGKIPPEIPQTSKAVGPCRCWAADSYPVPWKFLLLEAFLPLKRFCPMSTYFWKVFDWCSTM